MLSNFKLVAISFALFFISFNNSVQAEEMAPSPTPWQEQPTTSLDRGLSQISQPSPSESIIWNISSPLSHLTSVDNLFEEKNIPTPSNEINWKPERYTVKSIGEWILTNEIEFDIPESVKWVMKRDIIATRDESQVDESNETTVNGEATYTEYLAYTDDWEFISVRGEINESISIQNPSGERKDIERNFYVGKALDHNKDNFINHPVKYLLLSWHETGNRSISQKNISYDVEYRLPSFNHVTSFRVSDNLHKLPGLPESSYNANNYTLPGLEAILLNPEDAANIINAEVQQSHPPSEVPNLLPPYVYNGSVDYSNSTFNQSLLTKKESHNLTLSYYDGHYHKQGIDNVHTITEYDYTTTAHLSSSMKYGKRQYHGIFERLNRKDKAEPFYDLLKLEQNIEKDKNIYSWNPIKKENYVVKNIYTHDYARFGQGGVTAEEWALERESIFYLIRTGDPQENVHAGDVMVRSVHVDFKELPPNNSTNKVLSKDIAITYGFSENGVWGMQSGVIDQKYQYNFPFPNNPTGENIAIANLRNRLLFMMAIEQHLRSFLAWDNFIPHISYPDMDLFITGHIPSTGPSPSILPDFGKYSSMYGIIWEKPQEVK